MSGNDRIDYSAAIRAMGDQIVTIDTVAERLGMTYGQTYERIKALVRDNVAIVVRKGGSGHKSKYQLAVSVDRAIAMMQPPQDDGEKWMPHALEAAWPMERRA